MLDIKIESNAFKDIPSTSIQNKENTFYERIKNVVNKGFDGIYNTYDFIYRKNPETQKRQVWIFPSIVEAFMGYWYYPMMVHYTGGITFHQKDTTLINEIGNTLAQNAKRKLDYEFKVIRSPKINAWCFFGGKIAMYEGLLKGIKKFHIKGYEDITNEDKIAAVLSHEVIHASAGHTARGLEIAVALAVISAVFTAILAAPILSIPINAILAVIIGIQYYEISLDDVIQFLLLKHSRDQEFEADRYGMFLMERSGFNPKAALWALEFLKTREMENFKWYAKFLALFSTHPTCDDRLEENRKTLQEIEENRKILVEQEEAKRNLIVEESKNLQKLSLFSNI